MPSLEDHLLPLFPSIFFLLELMLREERGSKEIVELHRWFQLTNSQTCDGKIVHRSALVRQVIHSATCQPCTFQRDQCQRLPLNLSTVRCPLQVTLIQVRTICQPPQSTVQEDGRLH